MPPPRQLELYPQKKQSAEERLALIRKRLDGLEYRQRAREQRRRMQQDRRKGRQAGRPDPDAPGQVTIEEMIERLAARP
jgi:hypothetical protein